MIQKLQLEYVNLGLPSGTKWASCNFGASKPEEMGIRVSFDQALDLEKNKKIKIPTEKKWRELIEECSWKWKGNGYEVTGPNGNSIFLPFNLTDKYRRYWVSSLYDLASDTVRCLCIYSYCVSIGDESRFKEEHIRQISE